MESILGLRKNWPKSHSRNLFFSSRIYPICPSCFQLINIPSRMEVAASIVCGRIHTRSFRAPLVLIRVGCLQAQMIFTRYFVPRLMNTWRDPRDQKGTRWNLFYDLRSTNLKSTRKSTNSKNITASMNNGENYIVTSRLEEMVSERS